MNRLFVLGLLATCALAVPMPESVDTGNLDCFNNEDMVSCIAVKAVSVLGRAARSSDIKLMDGLTFVRDGPMERNGKALQTEVELLNEVSRDATDKTFKIATMLYDSAMSFFKSHSLKLSMPEGSISRALEEGRAKIKKSVLPYISAIVVKVLALAPIMLGGLALLVMKALFVGKIALLLAGILAFQKLFGGSSSTGNFFSKAAQPVAAWASGPSAQSWSSAPQSASQSGGYYRSFYDEDAHDLAYNAQIPEEAH